MKPLTADFIYISKWNNSVWMSECKVSLAEMNLSNNHENIVTNFKIPWLSFMMLMQMMKMIIVVMMMSWQQTHLVYWWWTSGDTLDWKLMQNIKNWNTSWLVIFFRLLKKAMRPWVRNWVINPTSHNPPLTSQPAETLPPGAVVSWPSVFLGPSCPRKSKPPPWLWAGGLAASAEACQNSVHLRYCRSYQSGRCRVPPLLPCLWTPPYHSLHNYLQREHNEGDVGTHNTANITLIT